MSHAPIRLVPFVGTFMYHNLPHIGMPMYPNVPPIGMLMDPSVPFFTQVSEEIYSDSYGILRIRGAVYYNGRSFKLCINMFFKSKEQV